MKPFMKYPGGKAKEAPIVNKYKPTEINRYFEPFVGGGAIFFELENKQSFINDYSKDLIKLYELLKEQNAELKEVLISMNDLWKLIENKKFDKNNFKYIFSYDEYYKNYKKANDKKQKTIEKFKVNGVVLSEKDKKDMEFTARKTAVYMMIRDIYNKRNDDTIHVACYFFLREYCYSSMFRFSKCGNFNVPYGGMSYNYKYLDEKIEYMFSNQMNDLLSKTNIYNMDFEVFLNEFILSDKDFIFLDPPYDSDFSTYDQNSFDKKEQIRLRDALTRIEAKWMLIIKKTDFIKELYSKFNIYEYDKNYMVSFKNRNEKDVKHLMITNYKIEVK